jgi:hypothetical protein
MSVLELTDEQAISPVRQLPATRKREALLALAEDAEARHDERMRFAESQLRRARNGLGSSVGRSTRRIREPNLHMKTISTSELRSQKRPLVRTLENGKTVSLIHRGHRLAQIRPLKSANGTGADDPLYRFHRLAEKIAKPPAIGTPADGFYALKVMRSSCSPRRKAFLPRPPAA